MIVTADMMRLMRDSSEINRCVPGIALHLRKWKDFMELGCYMAGSDRIKECDVFAFF